MKIYRCGLSSEERDRKRIAELKAEIDYWKAKYEKLKELIGD